MSDEVKGPWWGAGVPRGVDAPLEKSDGGSGGTGGLRFWLPRGQSKKVVFLTDSDGEGGPPPPIWEHNFYLNGGWRNWLTCLEPLGVPCPLCAWSLANAGKAKRYQAMFFTIIDTSEFKDKSGAVRKNLKRLFVAKPQIVAIMRKRAKTLSEMEPPRSLLGALFEIYRTEESKSSSVGDDFQYLGHVDLDRFEDTTQLDYLSILQPDPEKVKRVVSALKMGGSAAPDDGSESEIPF